MNVPLRVGVAGAGVLGRLFAYRLAMQGAQVTVFDPAPDAQAYRHGQGAAAFTAAGMLSPLAELEHAPVAVAELGARSLPRWQALAGQLAAALGTEPHDYVRCAGSLMVAHPSDGGAAQRVLARLARAPALGATLGAPQPLSAAALAACEPALAAGLHGWLLAQEGQVFPHAVLPALVHASGARWRWGETVSALAPGRVCDGAGHWHAFDWVIDCRGVGAQATLPVRGVRGEVFWLHAPGVPLHRPLRLLHPRHRVYLVPRPGDVIVVGASEIESADRSAVSVRSTLELLAAAHSALPALAEARVIHSETNLRPALPDNLPHTATRPGLLEVNGLFRHGWLLAPALVDAALAAAGLSDEERKAI